MSGDDRELALDRGLMALRWLAMGVEDLKVARLCLDACEPVPHAAAYHCQQAAEKLIKGLLVLADIPFTKTHDLRRLGTLATPKYPKHEDLFSATYLFTSWAFDFRYPGPGPEIPDDPDETELRQAMAAIERLADCLRTHIPPEPEP
ncbi:MAG: HEPN domain-containing protein [Acetobacteraceae bacterium]|nr:HEPN domain-containing protein [Acetobacteraceae bacterium]